MISIIKKISCFSVFQKGEINTTLGTQILVTFTEETGTDPGHKARNRLSVRSAGTEQIFLFPHSQNKQKVPAGELAVYY